MSENIISDVRGEFKDSLQEAYEDAQEQLEEKIMGKRVVLKYPKPYLGDHRKPEVEGIVDSIDVGRIPKDSVEFAVSIKFKSGDKWVGPDGMEILDNGPKLVSPSEISNKWRHVNEALPESVGDLSRKVEVYLDTGARKIDRFNHKDQIWESESETLEDFDVLDEHVEYWKPLEPDPQIEGRYQTNER